MRPCQIGEVGRFPWKVGWQARRVAPKPQCAQSRLPAIKVTPHVHLGAEILRFGKPWVFFWRSWTSYSSFFLGNGWKWMDMDGNGCHFAARQPSGSWSSPTVPLVGAYKPPLNQLNVRFISVPRMAFKEKSNKETGYWKPRKLEVKTWFRQQIFLTSIHWSLYLRWSKQLSLRKIQISATWLCGKNIRRKSTKRPFHSISKEFQF